MFAWWTVRNLIFMLKNRWMRLNSYHKVSTSPYFLQVLVCVVVGLIYCLLVQVIALRRLKRRCLHLEVALRHFLRNIYNPLPDSVFIHIRSCFCFFKLMQPFPSLRYFGNFIGIFSWLEMLNLSFMIRWASLRNHDWSIRWCYYGFSISSMFSKKLTACWFLREITVIEIFLRS